VAVEFIHSYLVYPGKGAESLPPVGGTAVPHEGKLFALLDDIYSNSVTQCDIDIAFNPSTTGSQQNPCRDLIVSYTNKPSVEGGSLLANRLRASTDRRSGMGLLFLLKGKEAQKHRVVISRFPANSAILVEEGKGLSLEFLERVFVKHAGTYKAAVFEDTSASAGFWMGKAVDRQVSSRDLQLSNYWITDFLDAGFKATAAAGTRRLAAVLRAAAASAPDVETKHKIAAAVTLAGGSLAGKPTSIDQFCEQFGLTGDTRVAIEAAVRDPNLLKQQFQFDATEFKQQIAYRSVELDTGGILMAPTASFDEVFKREKDKVGPIERFTAEGRVVNEKLAKR
jgi:hypothetical protein